MEVWKDIPGYEGLYQVSDQGRVKSLGRFVGAKNRGVRQQAERLLKPLNTGKNYFRVCLYKGGVMERPLVHRLVAMAFLPNTEEFEEVNHKDGNKWNNVASNLEWASHKANMQHAFATGLNGRAHLLNNKGSKPVSQFNESMEMIATYPSMHEAERQTGIDQGRISQSARHGFKAAGYYWKFAK